jgi:signal transduction histidine kinase
MNLATSRFFTIFFSARLKLTLWYLMIIMWISIIFSFVVYRALTNEIDRYTAQQRHRVEQRLREYLYVPLSTPFGFPQASVVIIDPDLVAEIKRRIIITLGVINGFIFISAGALGYILAGRTLEPIERMMAEQERFISDAAHELRTPLTSLKTSFEVHLRDKKLSLAQVRALLSESIQDVDRLTLLSESLLELSRFDQISTSKTFSKVQMNTILENVVNRMRPVASEKNITLHLRPEPISILGDSEAIFRVMTILVDNAIKYTPSGKEIFVTTKSTKTRVLALVQDQGIGIEPKDIPYIFDRFYRADRARSWDGGGGFGLGLAIAKKIVVAHGGTITVKSKKGEGTTFIISFPRS